MRIIILVIITSIALGACKKRRIEKNACDDQAELIQIDTCDIFLPNIFTPNGDGLNDLYRLVSECPVTNFSFEITKGSRVLFESNDLSEGWDGTYDGKNIDGIFSADAHGKVNGMDFSISTEFACIHDLDYEIENCSTCFFETQFTPTGILGVEYSNESICQ